MIFHFYSSAMFLSFEPVHEGGRHMKVASVQSPERQ